MKLLFQFKKLWEIRKKMKKLNNNSKSKLKAKDRLKISKFGKEFIEFFIENET